MTIADLPDHHLMRTGGTGERVAANRRRRGQVVAALERTLENARAAKLAWSNQELVAQYRAWCPIG